LRYIKKSFLSKFLFAKKLFKIKFLINKRNIEKDKNNTETVVKTISNLIISLTISTLILFNLKHKNNKNKEKKNLKRKFFI
jgi:RNA-binding protein YhbY